MDFDTNGLLLLFSIIILLVAIVYIIKLDSPKKNNTLREHSIFSNIFYFDGHPELDGSGAVLLYLEQQNLILESKKNSKKAYIPRDMISDIQILDKSTIIDDDPTTLKLYIGYWGLLASKLPLKRSIYLLVIRWHDQKCSHDTTFEFSGYQSARNASIARKILLDTLNL